MLFARIAIIGILAVAGSTGAATAQAPGPAEFLKALAGEWSVVSETTLGPGQEAVRLESREVARIIGGKWLIAEGTGTAAGAPFTSILTLGFDPFEGQFVGTWISGRQTHLWTYSGSLDASGSSLTLVTEGPLMGDPETTARYREVIEVEGPDRKVMRSMILGPDGEWFEFQRAEYQRDHTGRRPGEEEK